MGISDIYYDALELAKSSWKKLMAAFVFAAKKLKSASWNDLRKRLTSINLYRKAREWIVSLYLGRNAGADKKDLVITWQPFLYVAAKIGLGIFISCVVFGFYPEVARLLEALIRFFRLNEIYNFDMPGPSILNGIAQASLLVVIALAGFNYAVSQFLALFSSFAVNAEQKKAYYIKDFIARRELYVFSLKEIDHCILRQNILARLFGIGTIELKKKSGYSVRIASIKNASAVMKQLVVSRVETGK